MQYVTNHHWMPFLYRWDCSESELSELDYVTEDYGFIRYRGHLMHMCDFLVLPVCNPFGDAPFPAHGYAPDSFFSGLVLHISEDGEAYKIATFIS